MFFEEPKMNQFVQAVSGIMRSDIGEMTRSCLKQNKLKSQLAQSPSIQTIADNLRINLESLKRKLLRGDFMGDNHFKTELEKVWRVIKEAAVENLQEWSPLEVNVTLEVLETLKKQLDDSFSNQTPTIHHTLSATLGEPRQASTLLKKRKRDDTVLETNPSAEASHNGFESKKYALLHEGDWSCCLGKQSRRGSSDIGDSKKTEETLEADRLSSAGFHGRQNPSHDMSHCDESSPTGERGMQAEVQQRVADLLGQEQDVSQQVVCLLKKFGLADNETLASDQLEQSPSGAMQMLRDQMSGKPRVISVQRLLSDLSLDLQHLDDSNLQDLLEQLRTLQTKAKGFGGRENVHGYSPRTPERPGHPESAAQVNLREYLACSDELNDSNNTSFLTGSSSQLNLDSEND